MKNDWRKEIRFSAEYDSFRDESIKILEELGEIRDRHLERKAIAK